MNEGRTHISEDILRVGSKSAELLTVKIIVNNLRVSYDFYTQIVGLADVKLSVSPKPVFDDPDIALTQALLNFSGSPADPFVGLVKKKDVGPHPNSGDVPWLCVKVPDARAVIERATTAGHAILKEFSAKGATVGLVRDPDGYVVEILEAQAL